MSLGQSATAIRRRERREEILAATRSLFDARGVRDAQIEDVARAVGINRAIIYRHFSGKEELFALTLVGYLDELREHLRAAAETDGSAGDRLRRLTYAFLDFGERFPAFVDCALALLRRDGRELMEEISEGSMFALGQSIAGCLAEVTTVLEAGVGSDEFHIRDIDLLANLLYTQGLGGLQLARVGLAVRGASPGQPEVSRVSVDEVKDYLAEAALAMARGVGRT